MLAAGVLAACSAAPVPDTQPLAQENGQRPDFYSGYHALSMMRAAPQKLVVVVAFSGGGKRSAAFAHGALRGMAKLQIGNGKRLLDSVVYISAVSGGSFAAAHYGLYRDRSFNLFPGEFLYQDIEAFIYGIYLLPWKWDWMVKPEYGTNDAMAEVYDRLMFHGATFADLSRHGLPVISVNATDVSGGNSFTFVQETFNLLCADLAKFPLASAVAASNGFPVLFSPITLTNRAANCAGSRPPPDPTDETASASNRAREIAMARNAQRLMDPQRSRYVHLMDGGISDNLALRSLINGSLQIGGDRQILRDAFRNMRRLLVISIDGESTTDPTLGTQRTISGIGQTFAAVSGAQIDAYNFETLLLAEQQTENMVRKVKEVRCSVAPLIDGYYCDDVEGKVVHLALDNVANPAERQRLLAIPLGLTISNEDVGLLLAQGEIMVTSDANIRSIVDAVTVPLPGAVRSRVRHHSDNR